MAETGHPPVPHDNPEVRHEHSDVSIRGILMAAGIMVVSGVIIQLVVWWMYRALDVREKKSKQAPSSLAAREGQLPINQRLDNIPEPRLEGLKRMRGENPDVSADQLRASQPGPEQAGPTNEPGVVQIPIERAMELIVSDKKLQEKWLPARPAK